MIKGQKSRRCTKRKARKEKVRGRRTTTVGGHDEALKGRVLFGGSTNFAVANNFRGMFPQKGKQELRRRNNPEIPMSGTPK